MRMSEQPASVAVEQRVPYFLFALAFVVFAALLGCGGVPTEVADGAAPSPTSSPQVVISPSSTPAPPTVVPVTPTPAPPAATVTKEGCYDRGYAGRIRDRETGGFIYMLVEPPDDPADDARAIAETLCVLGGRFTPNLPVRAMKVNYTRKQLDTWYELLNGSVRQTAGVWSSSVDVKNNRLKYRVLTGLGKSRIFEFAVANGIPPDAVFVEIPPQIELDNPPVYSLGGGMELSVEYPQELISGQPTEFSVIVTNTNDRRKTIEYNSAYPADIAILDSSGTEIWRHMTGMIILPGGSSRLSPGESIAFGVSWHGLNHDGTAVPPGRYLVRGFVDLRLENESTEGKDLRLELSTAPEEIVIVGN